LKTERNNVGETVVESAANGGVEDLRAKYAVEPAFFDKFWGVIKKAEPSRYTPV
jgi:hypothetical protein